jgi:hypothetical protein
MRVLGDYAVEFENRDGSWSIAAGDLTFTAAQAEFRACRRMNDSIGLRIVDCRWRRMIAWVADLPAPVTP